MVGYEGTYEVSDLGRVRSLDREVMWRSRWGTDTVRRNKGTLLKTLRHPGGYARVTLWSEGDYENKYIHELVLSAFVGKRPLGAQACHGNGDKKDNRLVNLRWDTPSANQGDREDHGTGRRGRPHPSTQLCPSEIRLIKSLHRGASITKVAQLVGRPRTTVADVINGRTAKARSCA